MVNRSKALLEREANMASNIKYICSDIYNYYYNKLDGDEHKCVDFKLYKNILRDYFNIMINGLIYEKKKYELDRIGDLRIVKIPLPDKVMEKKFNKRVYWTTGRLEPFKPASPGYVYRIMWYNDKSWYPIKTKRWGFKPCSKFKDSLTANLYLPDHEEFEEYVRDDKSIINKPKRHHRQGYIG